MHDPMRPYLLPLLIVPVLLACSKVPPAADPVRAVRTVTVQSGSAALQHEYPAEVRARIESRLAFRVAGKLVRRMVNVGDVVAAGQALAQIDATDLNADIHASAGYRANLISVLTQRAVTQALAQA